MATTDLVLTAPEPKSLTPMDLLQVALSNNAAIDVIERLAALQDKSMARNAEMAFNDAMNRVQSDIRRIAPDLGNNQTNSKYASYAALDRVIRPIYSGAGFSLSFDTAETPRPESVRVLCYVSLGAHTRRYQIDMPADGKGAKGGDVMTKTHATGSAVTYGMRYLLKAIFNVAIGEDDDDGNGMQMGELSEKLEYLENASSREELEKMFRQYYSEAKQINDQNAMKAIIAKKDQQKRRFV